jgi:hypothetical protein
VGLAPLPLPTPPVFNYMQERVPPRFFPALNRDSFISPDRFRVYSLILPLSHLDSCHTVIIDKRVSQVSPKGRMFAPLYSLIRLVFRLSLDFRGARFQSLSLTHRTTSSHMNRPSRSWLKNTLTTMHPSRVQLQA